MTPRRSLTLGLCLLSLSCRSADSGARSDSTQLLHTFAIAPAPGFPAQSLGCYRIPFGNDTIPNALLVLDAGVPGDTSRVIQRVAPSNDPELQRFMGDLGEGAYGLLILKQPIPGGYLFAFRFTPGADQLEGQSIYATDLGGSPRATTAQRIPCPDRPPA